MDDYGDILAQQASIERRRRLLEVMGQQARAPIVGNSATSRIIQALAAIGQAGVGEKMSRDLTADTNKMQADYSTALQSQMRDYLNKREGTPAQTMADPAAVGPTMAPAIPADPRAAIVSAMASRFPELQQMGKLDFASLAKQETKDPFVVNNQIVDPKTGRVVADYRNPEKPLVVEGRVVDPKDPTKVIANYAKPNDSWGEPFSQGGDLYQKNLVNGQIRKLDNAAKVTTNVGGPNISMGKGETKLWEGIGTNIAKNFADSATAAQGGYRNLNVVNQMKELEKQGIYSGPTADLSTFLAGVANTAGLPVDRAKLANSEAFQQQFAQNLAGQLQNSSLARSTTDKDMEVLKAALPQMKTSAAARQTVYGVLEKAAKVDIQRHTSFQEQLKRVAPADYQGLLTLNPVDSNPEPGVLAPVVPPTAGNPSPSAPAASQWKVIR